MRYFATLCVFLVGLLIMSSCSFMPFSGGMPESRTPEERLLLVCEAWVSIFRRINTRDQFRVATDVEVEAVNKTIPILNPICEAGPEGQAFDIVSLETALLAVIAAEQGK